MTRPPRPNRLSALLALPRRFHRNETGATAIEFGMVSMPFLFLIFAIFEVALAFWSSQILETAVANAGRKLYTGEFQSSSTYATADAGKTVAQTRLNNFKTLVCQNVTAVFNCQTAVSIDVQTFSSFSSANVSTPPKKADGTYDTSSYTFMDPGASQITVVRASMLYPSITKIPPGPGIMLSTGQRLMMASAAFRTEPYK